MLQLLRTLMLSMVCITALSVAAHADEPPTDGKPCLLRVLTYNIRYDNRADGADRWVHRKQTVAEVIERHADLAGLQEVLHVQLRQLQALLPQFAVVGVGRDDGKTRGEYSPVFFRRERFDLLDSGTLWLSSTPEQAGSKGWDAALPRIATWAKLRDRPSGRTLLFVSAHFDHQGAEAREQSAGLLTETLPQLAGDAALLFAGDLNARPDSPPVARFKRQWRDTYDEVARPEGPDGTWNAFREIASGERIDYLFVGPGIKVKAHRTLDPRTPTGRFASDHLPVQAEVLLP